jgi:hypothetical protein
LAALIAVGIAKTATIPWAGLLLGTGTVTLISLFVYAFRMPYAQRSGGWLLGAAAAATLVRAYGFAVGRSLQINWEIMGLVAAAVTAFPAIVRFIPVLRTPAVRRAVLKVMLILAGLIIPLGAIALSFWFFHLGMQGMTASAPIWSPLHYTDGYVVLAVLMVVLGGVAIFLLNVNLTARIGSTATSWRGPSSTAMMGRRSQSR